MLHSGFCRLFSLAAFALAPLAASLPAFPDQLTFNSPSPPAAGQAKAPAHVFTTAAPTGLSSIASSNSFEVLSHPSFPEHQLRTRHPKGICDDTVESTAGYLDTANGRHFFSYQFDSRDDPENDPVVLWLNGGPGCSSFTGLLMELGPCRVVSNDTTVFNPDAWNNHANLVFLDQPVGVGYSYGPKNDSGTWTTEAAAKDVYAFLQILLATPKYAGKEFHIAGESYAGRYIPMFGDYIVRQNAKSHETGLPKINLKSVLIGNGFTNPKLQYAAYHPMVCTNQSSYGPFVSEDKCDEMAAALPRCQSLVQKCYDNPSNYAVCLSANVYCEAALTQPYYDTGRNPYDMLKYGPYKEEEMIHQFLNLPRVKHELGVDLEADGGVKEFIGCSDDVGFRFSSTGDQSQATFPKVAHMLENGVRVLTYSGRRDFICERHLCCACHS